MGKSTSVKATSTKAVKADKVQHAFGCAGDHATAAQAIAARNAAMANGYAADATYSFGSGPRAGACIAIGSSSCKTWQAVCCLAQAIGVAVNGKAGNYSPGGLSLGWFAGKIKPGDSLRLHNGRWTMVQVNGTYQWAKVGNKATDNAARAVLEAGRGAGARQGLAAYDQAVKALGGAKREKLAQKNADAVVKAVKAKGESLKSACADCGVRYNGSHPKPLCEAVEARRAAMLASAPATTESAPESAHSTPESTS